MIPVMKEMPLADKLLFFCANRLHRNPCVLIRDRFLKDYRCASESDRNKWNTETFLVLRSMAKHNDGEAIREIYSHGYPGFYFADEVWTEPTLAGIAAENQGYDALQALAECGEDISWYGSNDEQYTWKFVIENNDRKMCEIIANAKNRTITDLAASFMIEQCRERVPNLIAKANRQELRTWYRIAAALNDQAIIKLCEAHGCSNEMNKNDQIETLATILKYSDAAVKIEEAGTDFETTWIWNAIFPVSGRAPECYSYNYFYSDELAQARMMLMNVLFKKNICPSGDVIKSVMRSASYLRSCTESAWNNYLSTLSCLLKCGVYSYESAIRDAMRYRSLEIIDYLIESGPEGLPTSGLAHMLVETTQLGDWPKVLGNPIGRLLRFDLLAEFQKEHTPCFEKVNDILIHAQRRGMLDVNEQNSKGETPLVLLCKEVFPHGLRMPCVKELIIKLIAMGADASIVDSTGKTAYNYIKGKKAQRAILNLLRPL